MQVTRMGDGLAVRLPDDVVQALGLHEGDEVEIDVTRAPASDAKPARKESFEEFMAGFEEFRGMLPADFKFDRDEANAR